MISFDFIAENFEELEADFQREYGIDLRDALYGDKRIGARRLQALINGLSPKSATMRKVSFNSQEWGPVEELLAVLIEMVDMQNRMFYAANFDTKTNKVWKPVEVPRPHHAVKSKLSSKEEQIGLFTNPEALGWVVFDPTNAPDLPKDDEVTE